MFMRHAANLMSNGKRGRGGCQKKVQQLRFELKIVDFKCCESTVGYGRGCGQAYLDIINFSLLKFYDSI